MEDVCVFFSLYFGTISFDIGLKRERNGFLARNQMTSNKPYSKRENEEKKWAGANK